MSEFGNVHQYATIAANSSGRVFYYKVPSACVLFLSKVANNWYNNTYYEWKIDGALVEKEKIERQIATLNIPAVYDPPFLVERDIEWIAYNNTNSDLLFEVLNDGFLIDVTEIKNATANKS